ncbi:ATP-binding protein [Ruania albidiflava]|uniref:ATP-binding protein n=1 Tax=Ruania albidiflava TaxID=366586 RepID=UPI0023F206EB|nr:LuxR C-terminal-related transcriptional regulator [Ruania albidiflava]
MQQLGQPVGTDPQVGLTRFVGRDSEVDGVAHLLSTTPLVTLVGPPGVGKTRLAAEVAGRVADQFAAGLVPVPLATVTTGEDVAATVAAALRVRQGPGTQLADALVAATRDEQRLLLLDGCEHVLDTLAALVHRLLATAPQLRVLATSRVPLGVPGERLHQIRPLAPDAAADLFLDRASLVTELVLDERTRQRIDQVCDFVDHLPLAIEIAARQTRVLALPALLDRLRTALQHSPLPMPTSPEHTTLAATIDWSCQRLSGAQQRLLADLSVFAGSFDLAAIAAVAGERDGLLADLTALLDHSLLLSEPAAAGELSYRLLEPIRQHAAARLTQTGCSQQIRWAHAHYFLEAAGAEARGLMGPGGQECFARLQHMEANVLAAAGWARGTCSDLALRLVTCLVGYWEHRGQMNAARDRVEALLEVGMPAPRTRAEALLALCRLGYRQGRYRQAVAEAQEALVLMRSLPDQDGAARVLRALSQVAAACGDVPRAAACAEESVAVFAERGDRHAHAWSLTVLAYAHLCSGDIDAGATAQAAALRLVEPAEPAPALTRRTRVGMSYVAARRGDLVAHRRHLAGTIADLRLLDGLDGESEWLWSAVCLASSEHRPRAVLRLAAAGARRARRGTALPPLVDGIVRAAIADAEGALGPQVAAELRTEGAGMAAEELVTEALRPASTSSPLSPREHEIAMLTGTGLTNAEIAQQLVISRRTVETHQEHIRAKLGVTSRQAVIAWALTGESG